MNELNLFWKEEIPENNPNSFPELCSLAVSSMLGLGFEGSSSAITTEETIINIIMIIILLIILCFIILSLPPS